MYLPNDLYSTLLLLYTTTRLYLLNMLDYYFTSTVVGKTNSVRPPLSQVPTS